MKQGWHATSWPEDDVAGHLEPSRPPRRPVFARVNRFALGMVGIPLLSLVLLLAGVRGWFYSPLLLAAEIVLLNLDARELRQRGYEVTAWWWVIFGIGYLIHRTRTGQQSAVVPAAYAVANLTVLALGTAVTLEEVAAEQRLLEQQAARIELVEADMRSTYSGADVECDMLDWFISDYTETYCTIWHDDGWIDVDVTVDPDGTWTWVDTEATPFID